MINFSFGGEFLQFRTRQLALLADFFSVVAVSQFAGYLRFTLQSNLKKFWETDSRSRSRKKFETSIVPFTPRTKAIVKSLKTWI